MKQRLFILSVAILFFLPLFTGASPKTSKTTYLGAYSAEKMKPNGRYQVDVWTDNGWRTVTELTFDQFIRKKETDLTEYLPDGKPYKIRLVRSGTDVSHMDSLLLGGAAPVEIKGITGNKALTKVSKSDYDVLDTSRSTIEVTFPQNVKNKILLVEARMEARQVDKTPFQFPLANTFKVLDSDADFYTYKLNSRKSVNAEPFFKEFCETASGHPSGFTYGWVWNDNKNLYAKIDFTPDNTMDGTKDYAKVYVKTGSGLKSYKVSVADNAWGSTLFTYTDKVPYEHKVYDFKIPLKEIGPENKAGSEISLAFATYGTAAPGKHYPSIAFNSENNSYLVAYANLLPTEQNIKGRLADAKSVFTGDIININTGATTNFPSLAFDNANQKFLAVWEDERSSTFYDIYARFIKYDGGLSGDEFIVSNAPESQKAPKVAYDGANHRYLVVWSDSRNDATTKNDIYGQLVNADGTLNGANFIISNSAKNQTDPAVVYDSSNKRFMVVWDDVRSANHDIYGQLVNESGTLNGGNFPIAVATAMEEKPAIAYDVTSQKFLVAWNQEGASSDIYGNIVNPDGSLQGDKFVISNASGTQRNPSLAFDPYNKKYLAAWEDWRTGTNADVYGQYLNADGTLSGSNIAIAATSDNQAEPFVICNTNCSNYVVAFSSGTPTLMDIALSLVGDPCETTPPQVSSAGPANNATNVGTAAVITVTFNEAMKVSTINTATFTLNGVDGTVSYDSSTNTATFTPSANLETEKTYTVTITTGVKDRALNSIATNYTWSFKTGTSTDMETGTEVEGAGRGGCSLMQ